jgi:hypothetical protein
VRPTRGELAGSAGLWANHWAKPVGLTEDRGLEGNMGDFSSPAVCSTKTRTKSKTRTKRRSWLTRHLGRAQQAAPLHDGDLAVDQLAVFDSVGLGGVGA